MIDGRRLKMSVGVAIAAAILALPLLDGLSPHNPVDSLQTLDGCYEGEGLPDFIRPARHWSFRIANGSVIGREELTVSHISLSKIGVRETSVAFSPGILIAGKPATATAGDTVIGRVYLRRGRVILKIANERWLETTCS
jgi:hypothetical protein